MCFTVKYNYTYIITLHFNNILLGLRRGFRGQEVGRIICTHSLHLSTYLFVLLIYSQTCYKTQYQSIFQNFPGGHAPRPPKGSCFAFHTVCFVHCVVTLYCCIPGLQDVQLPYDLATALLNLGTSLNSLSFDC